jgi:epoxyqueuosine reductase
MSLLDSHEDLRTWIINVIRDFFEGPQNTLQNETNERAWDEPLVGFARGDDPLFQAYKEYVGPYHWTPYEIFSKAFPGSYVKLDTLTVICWVLPHTDVTKADNRKENEYPSERWARSRIFGEQFNEKLRKHVVDALGEKGYRAVAPSLFPQWEMKDSERYTYSSNWSERHAAYASGLGTFGLCGGLITPKGKAVRVGAVVACIKVPETPRPYTTRHEYCLFYTRGTCDKCMTRCPAGAITKTGNDKLKCIEHLSKTGEYVRDNYGFYGYGCGFCQTGVPCESRIPKELSTI